jgi:hypothetical protein
MTFFIATRFHGLYILLEKHPAFLSINFNHFLPILLNPPPPPKPIYRITGFLDSVHLLEFYITRNHNDSETGCMVEVSSF